VREEARGKVLLTAAVLEGLLDRLYEQLERLRLELKRKQFELTEAEGQAGSSRIVVGRNQRLNTRLPGNVSQEDVAMADGQLKAANARVDIQRVEIEEVEMRIAQTERRAARLKQVLKLAGSAKTSGIGAAAGSSTATPSSR
jgi:hypothetical protein